MKYTKYFVVFLFFIMLTCFNLSFAHPGSLDSANGHWNHKTGEYHYHTGENTRSTSTSSINNYDYKYEGSTDIQFEKKSTLKLIANYISEHQFIVFIICFTAFWIFVIIYAAINKMCNTIKEHIQQKALKKATLSTKIISKGVMNYYAYVSKANENKDYRLQVEIKVVTARIYTVNIPIEFRKKANLVSYELQRIYWGNGGYVSFVPENPEDNYDIPSLVIGKEIQVTSIKGEIYNVLLTDEIVEESIPQLDKVKKEQEYLVNLKKAVNYDIKKLLSDTKNKHEYFAELLVDYREYLNLKISDELKTKQRPALKAAEEIKQLSSKQRDLEKKYNILKYKVNMYENIFPWITELPKLPTDKIEEIKAKVEVKL